MQGETNVFGAELQTCGTDPITGFYRDGSCSSGPNQAAHLVCAVVTAEFLKHQRSIGNDLITPAPEFGFPGLQPGDRWCVAVQWHPEAGRDDGLFENLVEEARRYRAEREMARGQASA